MVKRYLFQRSPRESAITVTREALMFTMRLAIQTNSKIYTTAATQYAFPPPELEAIHPKFFNQLKKLGSDYINNVEITFLTAPQIYMNQPKGGVLLVPYCPIATLQRFDTRNSLDHIIYVPRTLEDARAWENTWHGNVQIVIGESSEKREITQLIATQLMLITASMDLISGNRLSNAEHHYIERAFQKIKEQGKNEDPELIVQWAVRHGWSRGILAEISELAHQYFTSTPTATITKPEANTMAFNLVTEIAN